jgi:hypothetical protein
MSDRYKRHVPKPTGSGPRTGAMTGTRPKAAGKTAKPAAKSEGVKPKEIGGPAGPEPTRYGDWEINGRCVDF